MNEFIPGQRWINYAELQRESLTTALDSATLRLDALRVLVAT